MEQGATSSIRVLLVEDHAVFRQALALAFSVEQNLQVVGQASSLAEARAHLNDADVVLLDLNLTDGIGTALIPELHAVNRRAEVLVLTASVQRLDLAQAVEAGAAGIIHKSAPLENIVEAVQRVAAGESLISRQELIDLVRMAGRQREKERVAEQAIARLTRRELEVLLTLGEGISDREIAERLFISKETVHTHMVNLLRKLELESRMQALVFAIRHGLVSLN